MTKRTPAQQGKHDQGVAKVVRYYEDLGYKVSADISGLPKPIIIHGRRPDVLAKKGKETVIVEVETKETLKTDVDQQKVFKRYADDHNSTRFRIKVV